MITGVAFCPQAPALVPGIGRGLDAELGDLRAACRAAIRRIASPGTPIVIVADSDTTAGFGPDVDAATVGEWLVRDAVGQRDDVVRVGPDELARSVSGPGQIALVVVGDGSAKRTEKAPGYLDERAALHDTDVAAALRNGAASHLLHDLRCLFAGVDPGSVDAAPRDLLVAGSEVWDAVSGIAHLVDGMAAELLYDDAPFGVGYFVAVWEARTARA